MGFIHDLRFGVRALIKSAGFTGAVVVMLALGIGVNTTIFTIVNSVVLKGMPFHDPGEIAYVASSRGGISFPDFADFKARSRSF